MATYFLDVVAQYNGHGGPASQIEGSDNHMKTPTAKGRYVIHSVSKHVSYGKYAFWSGVAWGTPVRKKDNITEVKLNGRWVRLTSINDKWGNYRHDQAAATGFVQKYYTDLYGRSDFPTTWVFNDFGHVSVKYFKDLNHDGRLNGKEHIVGDFIHTTPVDEADTLRGKTVTLTESHGCIHVKPVDVDVMIRSGYIRQGNIVEVHPYTEKSIPARVSRSDKRKSFEVHFFPFLNKVAVYKVN